MPEKLKFFIVPGLLICLAAAVFLHACQRKSELADIDPRDVIGQIELPGLKIDGRFHESAVPAEGRDGASTMSPPPDKINTRLPDFSEYSEVAEKKEAFFDFLRPIVRQENWQILQERAWVLLQWQRFQQGETLSEKQIETLHDLAGKYRIDSTYADGVDFFRTMLIHIDKIPVSLALIQAAYESGWGSSLFAREGNNLFGQWCFEPGCGLVPRQRPEGATYEVQVFDDIPATIRSYIRNLNSHPAYENLRVQRYRLRLAGETPDAHLMAGGLEQYAQIGKTYVNTVRQMIRGNEKFMGLHEPDTEL